MMPVNPPPDKRLRVGHLVGTFCPRSSTFIYGLATNPNVKGSVFCRERANQELYPYDGVFARSWSTRIRNAGNRAAKGCGSLLSRQILEWEWRRYTAKYRPQVLHAQHGNFAATLAPLRKTKIPLVVTFHGSDINTATYDRGYLSRLRQLFNRAAICHFVSEDLRDYAESLGCPPDRARTVYLGTSIPEVPALYSNRLKNCKFACVARLIPCKGHETLLKAFKTVTDEMPGAELHLFGDGPLKDRIKWLIDTIDIRGHVKLHGETNNSTILDRLAKNTDALLLSSHDDDSGRREGLPISLAEGTALGLPCIASRCGGIPELIQNDKTGLLVDQRNPDQLAKAMLTLSANPELRRRLGEASRQRATNLFNRDKQLVKITQLYQEIHPQKITEEVGIA